MPCQGWGKCVECEGTGHCDVCAGSGLRKVAEFPVSVKWLLRDVGCIVEDAGAYTIDGKSIDDINEDTGAGNIAAADCVRLARDNAVLPIGRGTNEIVCISEGQQHSWIAKSVLK